MWSPPSVMNMSETCSTETRKPKQINKQSIFFTLLRKVMYNDIIQIWMFKFQAIFLIEADVDERACIVTWVRWKLRIWKFFDLYNKTKMADLCLGFQYKHNMQHTIKYHFGKMGGGGILLHKNRHPDLIGYRPLRNSISVPGGMTISGMTHLQFLRPN